MNRPLAIALRPKRFSELIGQDNLVTALLNQYASGREPSALMFTGGTGQGKTTVARILGRSLQCTHTWTGAGVGEPCDACLTDKSFDIQENNSSEISGVEGIGNIARSSVYLPSSRRRVIILDEAQRMSKPAQNLLLKYLEDTPETTVWMVCTTEPNNILFTVRRRCQEFELKKLKADHIRKLVVRAVNVVKSKKPVDAILNALLESSVQSPGLILNVLEKYFAGMTAKNAVKSVLGSSDGMAICKAIEKGDWNEIKKQVAPADGDELRGIRAQVAGYLRRCLEQSIPGPRALEFAQAINRLAQVDSFTDATQGPATVAVMYELSRIFGGAAQADEDDGPRIED